jgi:hypothetical protein
MAKKFTNTEIELALAQDGFDVDARVVGAARAALAAAGVELEPYDKREAVQRDLDAAQALDERDGTGWA